MPHEPGADAPVAPGLGDRQLGKLRPVAQVWQRPASGEVEAFDLDDWRTIFDTNVAGTFTVCKHAIPALRASASPAIAISS